MKHFLITVFVSLLVLLIVAGGVLFLYRHELFQYTADSIIQKSLPPYISVGNIDFDLEKGTLLLEDFKIKNPEGFYSRYLATIETIACRYKMNGESIVDGIEITEIIAGRPVINIERLPNGLLNVDKMDRVMKSAARQPSSAIRHDASDGQGRTAGRLKAFLEELKDRVRKKLMGKAAAAAKDISRLVKLTDTIEIEDGRIIFADGVISKRPYKVIFEGINGAIALQLSDDYRKVLYVRSKGSGYIQGYGVQQIDWVIALDPTARDLKMSNRFNVNNVGILQFKPYFDEYAPINVEDGSVSGTLVLDFDDARIGSVSTLYLKDFKFEPKKSSKSAKYWQAEIPKVIRYLKSSSGEIIFDFKIKGEMRRPQFFPGPHLKQAMMSMAIDKISGMFDPVQTLPGGKSGGAAAQQTDAEKIVDILKELF